MLVARMTVTRGDDLAAGAVPQLRAVSRLGLARLAGEDRELAGVRRAPGIDIPGIACPQIACPRIACPRIACPGRVRQRAAGG